MYTCKSINCVNKALEGHDFCPACEDRSGNTQPETMAQKYPKYYKSVTDFSEVDVYAVHHLFNIQDPSGCIQHASKKLLLSGVRTGGKSAYKDITEARDTLTRWLDLNGDGDL